MDDETDDFDDVVFDKQRRETRLKTKNRKNKQSGAIEPRIRAERKHTPRRKIRINSYSFDDLDDLEDFFLSEDEDY